MTPDAAPLRKQQADALAMLQPAAARMHLAASAEPPAVIDEDGDEQHADPSWSGRYDPADGVDRAVMATRSAVFPLLGLHPEAY